MSGFRTIGVLGGMGPAATVDFLGKLLGAAGAARDQDHPRILVDCDPTLPDRHAAIRGEGPSPGPRLASMARGLSKAGAEVLCMPCNTAHAFEAEIRAATPATFVSIVEATADAAARLATAAAPIGLLAAQGALDADLYGRALAARGRDLVRLSGGAQARFMALIWRIKAGDVGASVRTGVRGLARELTEQGASVVVAACTEVPLVLADGEADAPIVDSTAMLARATIGAARL